MGLRGFFRRSRTKANGGLPAARRIGPEAGEPTPEQLAELEQASAELAQAAEGAGVIAFHACTRKGTSSWEDDPAAVRAVVAMLSGYRADEAAPDGPGSADR
jgi:hypothetical protein